MAVNKQLNPTSTALLILCFTATLAQNNQLRSGGLAGRYVNKVEFKIEEDRWLYMFSIIICCLGCYSFTSIYRYFKR